mgnify:CR=1 FL=1
MIFAALDQAIEVEAAGRKERRELAWWAGMLGHLKKPPRLDRLAAPSPRKRSSGRRISTKDAMAVMDQWIVATSPRPARKVARPH